MNDREKYALYQEAKKTGGPCAICGWRDGDGVRTCFYSSELGIVSHQNSERGTMMSMDESQRNLYTRRSVYAYIDAECKEKQIALVARDHAEYEEKYRRTHTDGSAPTRESDGTPIPYDAWVARYRASQEAKPLATDPQYAGWIQEYSWVPIERASSGPIPSEFLGPIKQREPGDFFFTLMTAYMMFLYEPHSCGKGHAYDYAPYHIKCTGCSTEIKLWEHGVDYDVG